jgi:DNA-binding transcriptional ArsR family regulator
MKGLGPNGFLVEQIIWRNQMNSKNLQRYEWEDYWIKCSTLGRIDRSSVSIALRLSMQINWTPKNGKRVGLNWANDLAAASVGIPRSTFRRHLKALKQAGCFKLVKGNLVPCVGDDQEEVNLLYVEHVKRLSKEFLEASISPELALPVSNVSSKSLNETLESHIDTPFTEDICTENILTEDSFSKKTDAKQPALSGGLESKLKIPSLLDSLVKIFFSLDPWRRIASKTHIADIEESAYVR